jgi:type IV pilus assembly protein PilC
LYIGVIVFLVLAFILIKFYRSKAGKRVFGYISLRIPIFGKIVQKVNCARFARSFASLVKSGLPVVESLTTTSKTLGNIFYSNSLIEASESIKKGKKIQESLERHRELYPVLVVQMIGVGEQTGELSGIMERLADFYEEEVKNITDNLASVIEPILMIILGGAVGFFAISMIQPMYSMMGTI